MTAVEVAVGAVVLHDDQILLVRRGRGAAAGRWSVPGGRVEYRETLHEAVVREVREETALDVVVDAFLGWVERMGDDPDDPHYVILDFSAVPLDPDPQPVAGDDAAEALWVALTDLDRYVLVDGLAEFLHDAGILPGPGGTA